MTLFRDTVFCCHSYLPKPYCFPTFGTFSVYSVYSVVKFPAFVHWQLSIVY